MDGNTYYFLRLEGDQVFYTVSAAQNQIAVILNVGDTVTIQHELSDGTSDILSGTSVTLDRRGDGAAVPSVPSPSPNLVEPDPEVSPEPQA